MLSTTPAYALFGAILAGIQRAQMIINQGLQIYEQKVAKLTMDGQLTELGDQFSHIKDQALGNRWGADRSVHRLGFCADAVYRPGPVVEKRLYRHRP